MDVDIPLMLNDARGAPMNEPVSEFAVNATRQLIAGDTPLTSTPSVAPLLTPMPDILVGRMPLNEEYASGTDVRNTLVKPPLQPENAALVVATVEPTVLVTLVGSAIVSVTVHVTLSIPPSDKVAGPEAVVVPTEMPNPLLADATAVDEPSTTETSSSVRAALRQRVILDI